MTRTRRARERLERRYPRLTLRVDVRVETPSGAFAAVATTLGAGGLFVATAEPLPPHTPLVVSFCLPGEAKRLSLAAHVAWSERAGSAVRTPGMGLEFDGADARAALAVRMEEWAEARAIGSRSGTRGG